MSDAKDVEQKVKRVKGLAADRADRDDVLSSGATQSAVNTPDNSKGTVDGNDALGDYTDGKDTYSYQMLDVSTDSSRAFRYDNHKNVVDGVGDTEQDVNGEIDKDPNGNAYADNKYKPAGIFGYFTQGPSSPSFDNLVKTTPDGSAVDAVKGTIDNPNVHSRIKPGSIFIDNTPVVEDVRQNNIGDCFFLAAVLHIIQRDPQKILDMMSVSGNQVTAKFFYQASGFLGIKSWKEVSITTQIGELERTVTHEDGTSSTSVKGSHFRLEYEPSISRWTANIADMDELSVLDITREDYYQAALWVISLEHAYEVFSQKYGQYGKGENTGRELVESIDGGFEEKVFDIFYGKKAVNEEEIETHAAEMDDILEANKDVIECLWKFQRSQNGDYNRDVFMSGYNYNDSSFDRYDYYKDLMVRALNAASHSDKSDALDTVDEISDKIHSYQTELSTNDKARIDTSGINTLTQRLYAYQSVHEVANDILNPYQNAIGNLVMDDDHNLYIYSEHAYNISNVRLVDSSNNLLTGSSFKKAFKKIDLHKSSVTMQNPWAHGTPNIDGSSKNGEGDQGKDYGSFTTPLGEYLASVQNVSYAEIKK